MPTSSRADARLTALAEEHFDFVWRLLRRLGLPPADADDATQQVFMIAMQKLDKIETGSERTFLYGAAIRVAANARRKVLRRASVLESEDTVPRTDTSALPDRAMELQRARRLLDELLALLPDDLRRVLVLAEVEQLDVPEIAQLESIPTGTAASRLRRARAKFRELLQSADARNPFKGASDD